MQDNMIAENQDAVVTSYIDELISDVSSEMGSDNEQGGRVGAFSTNCDSGSSSSCGCGNCDGGASSC